MPMYESFFVLILFISFLVPEIVMIVILKFSFNNDLIKSLNKLLHDDFIG